jgi:hypothetical protein
MSRIFSDPLLSITQKLLRALSALLFFLAGLVLAIALIGLIFGVHTSPYATTPGGEDSPLLFLAIAAPLAIYGWFLLTLEKIVGSVKAGSPFVAINADRLARMGWIALLLKLVSLAESGLMPAMPYALRFASRLSGPDVLVILVLFILARVFRQGAAMHADLEGTI